MEEEFSQMQSHDNKKKIKKEILAVIIVSLVCLIIAATFVIQYAIRTYNEEKAIKQISDNLSEKLSDNSDKIEELRKNSNPDLVGTYYSKGELSEKDEASAIAVMKLLPDGKVQSYTFTNSQLEGWWTSSDTSGIELVAVGLSGRSEVSVYQVSGSYLMDTKSVYFGEIEKTPFFDTTLVCESPTGNMKIVLDKTGKAKGEFTDTNEKSANNGVTLDLRGSYTTDGDFIDITLNTVTTRFLTFDYNSDKFDKDSGMASIYFEKTNQ